MSVEQAGEIRDRFGYRALIVVGVRDDGTVDVMSHGRDRDDCRVISAYAQGQFGDHLPRVPFQTWFGWGNAGVPLALSAEQLATLGEAGQRYAAANTPPDALWPSSTTPTPSAQDEAA